jgi:hypothetical protein
MRGAIIGGAPSENNARNAIPPDTDKSNTGMAHASGGWRG